MDQGEIKKAVKDILYFFVHYLQFRIELNNNNFFNLINLLE